VKNIKVGWYLLFAFLVLLPLLLFPRILIVDKIECFSQYGRCDGEFTKKYEGVLGKNVREAKKDLKNIIDSDRAVESYSASYKIPKILRLDLILNKAKYAMRNDTMDKLVLIDKEGRVIAYAAGTNVPVVKIKNNLPYLGEYVSKKQHFALDLIYGIYYFYQIKEGLLEDDYMQVQFSNDVKVMFPLEGDRDVILGGLKLILSRLNQQTEESKIVKAKEIDLRYKNPIIR